MNNSATSPSPRKHVISWLTIIWMAALFMRVFIGEVLAPLPHHGGMTHTYFNYATNLITHGVYARDINEPSIPRPDSLRMPLYSLCLAGVRLASGPVQWENWVISIQYILGAFICVFIALLGWQLIGKAVGLVAGFLAVFYIDFIYISIVFLREDLSLFLLLLFLNCYVRFIKTGRSLWLGTAAFFYGISILNRPEVTVMAFMLVILNWKILKDKLTAVKPWLALATVLAFGPWVGWMVRNYAVHGHILPFSTDGAWTLLMGQVYHPDDAYTIADPTAMKMIATTPVEYVWYQQMNHEALVAFLHHPFRNLYWGWLKVQQTFLEYSHGNGQSFLYPLLWILIPFFGVKNKRFRRWGLLAGIVCAALHFYLGAWDRYRPVGLLHIRYTDIILLGAIGFPLLILKAKHVNWAILAVPFLTLIITNVVFIALLRSRIILFDWVLLIGASYLIVKVINEIQRRSAHVSIE